MEMSGGDTPSPIDPRINVIVSLIFLIGMLSVPLGKLSLLICFTLFPIIASAVAGISYTRLLLNSLYILPLAMLIGLFNPIFDRLPLFRIGNFTVTSGWITFISVCVRGILAMQCILILIESCGFRGTCNALRKLGIPSFLTEQLMFVYRYLSVLLLEALTLRRARESRGYGRKNFPIKLWATMTGQLFLRTLDRAERINRAMLARGFNGSIPTFQQSGRKITTGSWIYLILMGGGTICMRFLDISAIFNGITR